MALDVPVPDPPDLTNRGMPTEFEWVEETLGSEDFHREDLEALLEEGAWKEGFNEWAEYTDLDEREARAVDDLGLFQAFDFFWDPIDIRLRFEAPSVPEDWRAREETESFDSSDISMIDTALQDLGETVREMLERYLEQSGEVSEAHWRAER